MRLLRDGVLSIVDDDRELACTVKRTNVICDHINKWSKRKLGNMTDEMQWVVLTRSRPMRSVVAILDYSFSSSLSRSDACQHYFWGMWCILVCHLHLTIIICCTAVWAQACGSERKTSFVIIVHLWFNRRPRSFSGAVGVLVGAVSRYCRFWYRVFGPSQP